MQLPDRAAMADSNRPAAWAAALQLAGLDREHQPQLFVDPTSNTCMPATSKIASARAHQRAPEPHVK